MTALEKGKLAVLTDKQKAEKDLLKRIVLWERADANNKLLALNPPKNSTSVKTPCETPVKSENGKKADGVSGSRADDEKNGTAVEGKNGGDESILKKECEGDKSIGEKVVADVKVENGKHTDDDEEANENKMDIEGEGEGEGEEIEEGKDKDVKAVENKDKNIDEEKKNKEKDKKKKEEEEEDDDTDDNSMDSEDSDSLLASSVDDEEEVINDLLFFMILSAPPRLQCRSILRDRAAFIACRKTSHSFLLFSSF